MVPFQNNKAQTYKTTTEILQTNFFSLILNRDKQGFSQGSVFLDQGILLSELDQRYYEHYQFKHSGKALRKWAFNRDWKQRDMYRID
jgi:hypothetical protein